MLTWLRSKPSTRRAARPAATVSDASKKRPVPPPVEEDMPPPFFADNDTAFLDLGDEQLTPPPLPPIANSSVLEPMTPQSRLAKAVLALPPFPERRDSDRMRQLLEIFRSLDRIASAACNGVETKPNNR